MNKEEKASQHIKKSTAIAAAVICLAVGLVIGYFFNKVTGTNRTVRKRPVQPQSISQTPPPQVKLYKHAMSLHAKVLDNPKDAESWANLGHTYFDMDEAANAIQAYKKHLELKPGNADVWTDLGVMYRRSGKPEEAIKAFDKAMAIDANHKPSRFNKGVVYLHDLKNPAEALKAWEELLKIDPAARASTGQSIKDLVEQLRKQLNGSKTQ